MAGAGNLEPGHVGFLHLPSDEVGAGVPVHVEDPRAWGRTAA